MCSVDDASVTGRPRCSIMCFLTLLQPLFVPVVLVVSTGFFRLIDKEIDGDFNPALLLVAVSSIQ
jgi:hypothetical protein